MGKFAKAKIGPKPFFDQITLTTQHKTFLHSVLKEDSKKSNIQQREKVTEQAKTFQAGANKNETLTTRYYWVNLNAGQI